MWMDSRMPVITRPPSLRSCLNTCRRCRIKRYPKKVLGAALLLPPPWPSSSCTPQHPNQQHHYRMTLFRRLLSHTAPLQSPGTSQKYALACGPVPPTPFSTTNSHYRDLDYPSRLVGRASLPSLCRHSATTTEGATFPSPWTGPPMWTNKVSREVGLQGS